MSFSSFSHEIAEGDTVILYVSINAMFPVRVTERRKARNGQDIENVMQTKYGALRVADLIGKRFGSRVSLSRGWAYALHPTPELWTKALPHRTQILYATDIALIVTQLELRPGSVVVESGTGSGSLSHSLARTIAPTGHLHTFDFHEVRADTARQEFEEHGISAGITVRHRDVLTDGFDLVDVADAVFLDLPRPWDAIRHAKQAMKKSGGRLCSFSPCIEQVQKTAEELRAHGFTEVETMECLLREFQVRRITLPVFDPNMETCRSEGGDEPKKRKFEEVESEEVKDMEGSKKKSQPETSFVTGVPLINMPGHTGFLTFATLPKCSNDETCDNKDNE